AVAVNEFERSLSNIRQLVEFIGRNIDRLSSCNFLPFFADTDFSGSFQNQVYLLLRMVVPRHLPTFRIQGYHTQREIVCLNPVGTPRNILCESPGGEAPAFCFIEIRYNHVRNVMFYLL